jgi:putative tryptophan/tyrosine transport system substrate-binding protein
MRRREVIGLFASAAAGWPLGARAQQPGKSARIGYLVATARDDRLARKNLDTFRQELRELGYIEGQNLVIEQRFAERDFDRLPRLAAELVRLRVDIIVASPTPAAVAAKKATDTIPIVMLNTGDPVGLGLVASLARPGGNVTGLSYSVGLETFGKGLELLKEAVPDLHRVAVLSNPANPAHALAIKNIEIAARALRLELHLLEARGPEQFESAFASMAEQHAGAVVIEPDTLMISHAARLAELAVGKRLPSMHAYKEEVKAGGLMSYGPSFSEPSRRAAAFVDKLLKGANPAELPIQQPTKFELVINLKTAKVLGLTIPPSLLARADEVIE